MLQTFLKHPGMATLLAQMEAQHKIMISRGPASTYYSKDNAPHLESLYTQIKDDSNPALANFKAYVMTIDGHFLKRISGEACANAVEYKRWANNQAKQAKLVFCRWRKAEKRKTTVPVYEGELDESKRIHPNKKPEKAKPTEIPEEEEQAEPTEIPEEELQADFC